MARSPEYPDLLWMPPASYTPGRHTGQPTKITVHYTAGREGYGDVDLNDAHYCQVRVDGTSAHYFIDGDSCTQCVRTTDEAHTALEHGNDQGIHYELCGTAQTRAQWLDAPSRDTIRIAARQMARDMRKYGIPLVRLQGRQVRNTAAKGICGHVDWTVGWPEDDGTHTDPGPYFPWDVLFDDIRAELEGDPDMAFTDEDSRKLSEVHRLLYEGKRLNDPQTSGGGVPIAFLPRAVGQLGADLTQIYGEVDSLEETDAQILATVQAIQAGDPAAVAEAVVALMGETQANLVADVIRDRLAG